MRARAQALPEPPPAPARKPGRTGGGMGLPLRVLQRLYLLAPLLRGAVRLSGAAMRSPLRARTPAARLGREALTAALPGALGLMVFVCGATMLFSAATPDIPSRLRLSATFAPLLILETSHFIDSLIGALLLFLAFGLNTRLLKAWRAAFVLLIVGAVSTLLRGFNYEEAALLGLVAAVLFAGRKAFYRRGPLRDSPLTAGMVVSIAAVLAAISWLGFFAYRHVEYRDELWWTFVADEGAPRMLRATVGVAALVLAVFAWRLTQPRSTVRPATDPAMGDRIEVVLAKAENAAPEANLALLGDKQFLFSDSGESFIQYAARGRNWVAMGEPVGRADERQAMIWAFRELCDLHGARPVFYAIRRDAVADFVDCGFVAAKIGENAIVRLADFHTEGKKRAPLRHALAKGERDGLSFDVLPSIAVEDHMADLSAISSAWLKTHQGEEKGFSLGRFDPAYVRRFDVAVLRREERIVAFANLWRTGDGKRVAIDLMRYGDDAPTGTMDVLLIGLMLWAKANGFEACDLGRTPLAGLPDHRLANLVTRIGSIVYSHAGELYGFEGLRRYKSKFMPEWESSYIAAPAGWLLPSALGDAALLSSGGLLGLMK